MWSQDTNVRLPFAFCDGSIIDKFFFNLRYKWSYNIIYQEYNYYFYNWILPGIVQGNIDWH